MTSDCKDNCNDITLNDKKPWIHVPEGYVGRYQQNTTSDQFRGLCTTQFTSCWPIIIIHKQPTSQSPITLSLIHFSDNSQPSFIKLEIDHIIGNKATDEFTADNCHIFIIRQLSHKHAWEAQQRKQMLLRNLSKYLNKEHYTIIDLPIEDETGFIGIEFAELSNIANPQNLSKLNKYLTKLSRTNRDLTIQQNPFFLIRHPKEYHLRCFYEIEPLSSELQIPAFILTDINDIPVIFDNSHWVNIDNTICYQELDKFMKKYKSYPYLMLMQEIGVLFSNAFPEMTFSENQNDITNVHLAITSIVFYIYLWNNNFNLKEVVRERIDDLREKLKSKQFIPSLNELYQMKKPFTNKLVNDALNEMDKMIKDDKNELLYYSEEIYQLSSDECLHFLNNFTMFTQIYSNLRLNSYQSKIKDIEQYCINYSKKGKEMYIKKDFNQAILHFNKALKYCIIFYANGNLSFIRAYYNLGASYHNTNDLVNAKRCLLIAANMCKEMKYQNEDIKSLNQKILKRLSEFQ